CCRPVPACMGSKATTPAASFLGRRKTKPQPSRSHPNDALATTNTPASIACMRSTQITSGSPVCGRPTRGPEGPHPTRLLHQPPSILHLVRPDRCLPYCEVHHG